MGSTGTLCAYHRSLLLGAATTGIVGYSTTSCQYLVDYSRYEYKPDCFYPVVKAGFEAGGITNYQLDETCVIWNIR